MATEPAEVGPDQQALARAEAAFTAGDFAALREALPPLRDAASPEVRARAAQLERAVAEDPVFAAVIAACLTALSVVFAIYVLR